MTDTQLSSAIAFPEDDGTGVSSTDVDHASAGHFGLHAQNQTSDAYVANGLTFSNVDTTNETVDVTNGFAFVPLDNVDVQSGSGEQYDTTLPSTAVMTIILPSSVSLSLDTDAVNDIYLAHDPTSNDAVYIRHGSAVSAPSDPSVKLGTVDTSTGDTTRTNDLASPTYQIAEAVRNMYVGGTESDMEDAFGVSFSSSDGTQWVIDEGAGAADALFTATSGSSDPSSVTSYFSRGDLSNLSAAQGGDSVLWINGSARTDESDFDSITRLEFEVVNTPSGGEADGRINFLTVEQGDGMNSSQTRLVVENDGVIGIEDKTFRHNRVSISSNTTTSGDGYYSVDTSGGAVTVTLASADAVDGLEINVKRNGSNDVTIDTEGSETVEDGSSYTLSADNESATLVYNSNTTDWEVY